MDVVKFQEELLSRLLTLAYHKNIHEASVDGVSIKFQDNGYDVVHGDNLDNAEAVMLVLGQAGRWDDDFETMFQDKLEQWHVPTFVGEIDTRYVRPLFLFRVAVDYLREQPTPQPLVVQEQPIEGELLGCEEVEKSDEHWASIRKAKTTGVEYTKIEPLLKAGAVTQIVLYPKDSDEKPIVFPDRTAVVDGRVLKQDLTQVTYDRLMFVMADGTTAMFQHHQDCCEDVYIEDIEGDFMDLIGRPLLIAEEASHTPDTDGIELPKDYYGREIWTFYRFAGEKGMVVVRWLGSSNGYYGEEVWCDISHDGKRESALGHDDESSTS